MCVFGEYVVGSECFVYVMFSCECWVDVDICLEFGVVYCDDVVFDLCFEFCE